MSSARVHLTSEEEQLRATKKVKSRTQDGEDKEETMSDDPGTKCPPSFREALLNIPGLTGGMTWNS